MATLSAPPISPQVVFHTLGCKLNFSESSSISNTLQQRGYEISEHAEHADVFVLNTCSVTENADKECRSIIRRLKRKNPTCTVAVIGCYAQLKPKEIAAIDGVDIVLGAKEKFDLPFYIEECRKTTDYEKVHACEIEETNQFISAYSKADRTRTFLKIQDGCDYPCTYCTIPLARGISRSDTIENILLNVQEIVASGSKEIVLTGVNIGDYGKGEFGNKKHKHTFLDLLKALDTVEGIERYRISSIEPNLLRNEVIDFVAASSKFVPHFHIPLQSGSDKTLKNMRRRYNTSLYRERIERIREKIPHCCIGVDVIVGFPGETQDDFLDTYQFINELPVSYLHVFSFSKRENTPAFSMDQQVENPVKQERSKQLRILSAKKKVAFYKEEEGQEAEILVEDAIKKGFRYGYTKNYVRVRVPADQFAPNTLYPVTLKSFHPAESVYTIV